MDQSNECTLVPLEIVDEALRPQQLKAKQMCRLCLTQDAPLGSIFAPPSSSKCPKTPLMLQIMACVSLEVHAEDDLPGMICENCQILINHFYQFKQICKTADSQLNSFLSSGIWPEKLSLPSELITLAQSSKKTLNKVSPRTSSKLTGVPNTPVATPPKAAAIEQPKKVNVIKLSPTDLKNLKLGRRITMGNPETPPAAVRKTMDESHGSVVSAMPLHTSTPVPKRITPMEQVNNRQSSKMTQPHEPRPVKKEHQTPVILNKLAGAKARQQVQEEFVATGVDTVQMVMKFESEPAEAAPAVTAAAAAVEVQTTGNVFSCTECSRSFKLKQLLDIHKLNHKRERNHPCEECEKRFFSKYDLAKHMSMHTGERPFVCVICRAAFSRSTLLTRHQASHKDELTHHCMYCERVFVSEAELAKHALIHEKNRPFKCASCPKSFAYKQGLERHEVVHTKEQPYQCQYCDMSFRTPGLLARHLTAHAGNRPYPCRLCKKSFLMSHHLSRHLRQHNTSGQSAYKCTDCNEYFSLKNELIYHSAKHATQNLICPLCREQFGDVEQVTAHIQMHASTVPFGCDYCDLMYTSEEKLANHCQEQHANELASEWSEEQRKQLKQEEEDAQKQDAQERKDEAEPALVEQEHILLEGEVVDAELLIDGNSTEIMETEHVYLQGDDGNHTALFMGENEDSNEKMVETIEVTEYVIPSEEEVVSAAKIAKENITPPAKLTKIKQEPQSATGGTVKLVSRQKSLGEYFRTTQETVQKKTSERNVSEALKKLPKGVTIKREASAPSLSIVVPSNASKPLAAAPQAKKTSAGSTSTSTSSSSSSAKPLAEKTKAAVSQASAKAAPVEGEKRRPGRPPKLAVQPSVKEENGEVKKAENNKLVVRKADRSEPEAKQQEKPSSYSARVKTEKKSPEEGGLKRTGTMNFPKARIGIDNPVRKPEPVPAKSQLPMVRRSYAATAKEAAAAVTGMKRPAEKLEAADGDEAALPPAKRPVPLNRKTLNPSMLSAMQKTTGSGRGGDEVKAAQTETGKVVQSVVRTVKRVATTDGPPVGKPVEMNVGGKKITMQKVILSKDEALALQKAGKLKVKQV